MKLNFNKILNLLIALFSFVIIIDPPGTNLHLKDPLFILLLFCCLAYKKPNYQLLLPFVLSILIWIISSVFGHVSCEIKDISFNIGMLKALIPFILLGWIKYLNFTKSLLLPCCVISIISIVVVIAMTYFPILEGILYKYFTMDKGLMMISKRQFLGIDVASAFYRSTPLIIFPLSEYIEKYFESKKKSYFYISLLLFLGLLSGGNRACMLSAIGIITLAYVLKLYIEKRVKLVAAYIFIFSAVFFIVILLLLSDTHEESNVAKFGHLISYLDYFNDNPYTIIIGQGAGSLFFTQGFNGYAVQTEWTYVELIRYFGVGALIIVGIFVYPIIMVYKNKRFYPNYGLSFIMGCIFYLVLAGTNPLLLGSTGLLASLYSYSYIYNGKK